jgi:apolipoprotein N-acyltransferase
METVIWIAVILFDALVIYCAIFAVLNLVLRKTHKPEVAVSPLAYWHHERARRWGKRYPNLPYQPISHTGSQDD